MAEPCFGRLGLLDTPVRSYRYFRFVRFAEQPATVFQLYRLLAWLSEQTLPRARQSCRVRVCRRNTLTPTFCVVRRNFPVKTNFSVRNVLLNSSTDQCSPV